LQPRHYGLVKLTMVLCDYVAVADGKLYISGGGWNITGPTPVPTGIALLLEVPWTLANRRIPIHLRLLHEDGQPVSQPTPMGEAAVELKAEIEVGRPAGVVEGTPLPVPMPVNLPPLLLTPEQGFYWEAEIDGEKREDWRLSFRTRGVPPAPPSPTNPTTLPNF
jgi:hypothetical protein